jgi:very-short-patch-repair endonuclease
LLAKINEQTNEQRRLKTGLAKQKEHKDLNDEFLKSLKRLNDDYTEVPKGFRFSRIQQPSAYFETIDRVQKICESPNQSIAAKLYLHKFKNHLRGKFNTPNDWLNISDFPSFSRYFVKLNQIFTTVQNKQREITNTDTNSIRKIIKNLSEDIKQLQNLLIKLQYKFNVFSKIKQHDYNVEVEKFDKMLFNTSSRIIDKRMKDIDFKKVTDVIPFWTAEIRHLGHLFPLQPDIFDLVVVDESSQVNLAEILPAFYRGKKICIVGDHHQLSIKSTGLSFALSASFDKLTWNHYSDTPEKRFLSFENATKKCLTVSKASILDFIKNPDDPTHIPEIMLDEHFRSLPQLSRYTSREFYKDDNNPDGKLKIMTETPHKLSLNCFEAIRVNGKRETETKNKFIRAEAEKVIEIISDLINVNEPNLFPSEFHFPEHVDKDNFTIGVISMIRDQCELIKELCEEKWPVFIWNKYELMVGTPEEFQGNERDIMIFSLCLDTDCLRGQGHFQDEKRLNVATSRAKSFTYLVYCPFPKTFNKIIRYINQMGIQLSDEDLAPIPQQDFIPRLSPLNFDKFDSDFERYVYSYLDGYLQTKCRQVKHKITLHNQVKSCGQKKLDFVIYNHNTKKSVAIEVDGSYHFANGLHNNYTEDHIERIKILTTAGWNIINTPYHKWYKNGWLSEDNDYNFKQEIARIYEEIDRFIL